MPSLRSVERSARQTPSPRASPFGDSSIFLPDMTTIHPSPRPHRPWPRAPLVPSPSPSTTLRSKRKPSPLPLFSRSLLSTTNPSPPPFETPADPNSPLFPSFLTAIVPPTLASALSGSLPQEAPLLQACLGTLSCPFPSPTTPSAPPCTQAPLPTSFFFLPPPKPLFAFLPFLPVLFPIIHLRRPPSPTPHLSMTSSPFSSNPSIPLTSSTTTRYHQSLVVQTVNHSIPTRPPSPSISTTRSPPPLPVGQSSLPRGF